jgi:outer membrane protein OmpA-like peptidoglycan-associated protein
MSPPAWESRRDHPRGRGTSASTPEPARAAPTPLAAAVSRLVPSPAAVTCPGYSLGEAEQSRGAGWLPEPVVKVSDRRWVVADFAVGSAGLPTSARADPRLHELYRLLHSRPDIKIDIVGYSDCVGTATANTAVRQARAQAVETWLGVTAPGRVTFCGMAALAEYLDGNAGPLDRARNRAVVIELRHPQGPADLTGRHSVVVVGAPGPDEARTHPFQFADAAARLPADPKRVWLVERTGYELAGADLSGVTSRAAGQPVFWISPDRPLVNLLNAFPPASISSMNVFSHGLAGQLTLRYGWLLPDYGLSLDDARQLAPGVFTDGATLDFDSCNTATDPSTLPGIPDDEVSLAQVVANRTGLPVNAWVGRTSYRLVNRGQGGVIGSQIWPDDAGIDKKEFLSQLYGRVPRKVVTAPEHAVGSWSSWFRLTARLPATRDFPVREGGSVQVGFATTSDYQTMQDAPITVLLHRRTEGWRTDSTEPERVVPVGQEATVVWQSLPSGTYYLELYHLSGLLVEGSIRVRLD